MRVPAVLKPGLAVIGLAVVAACTSSAHRSAGPATTASPQTTVGTATTRPAPSTSTVPSGPPACPTSQLAVTLGPPNGTAGSTYFALNFRNQGTGTCRLEGYPGVSYVTGSSGTQVGSPATRVAAGGTATSPQAIDVAPGSSAHATLRAIDVGNYPPATCTPTPVLGLRVYPPDQTAAAFVSLTSTGCAQSGPEQLQVSFVVAGGG